MIAALGGAALVWIWWRWESVASRVADIQVKVLTVVVKALAAAVAAGGAYATGEKSHWWSPVAAGLACVVVWEVIEKLVDARVKAADRVAKAEFAALKSVCEERTELLDVFRCALEDRYGHMAEVVRDRGENPTIPLCVTRSPQRPQLKNLLRDLLDLFAFRAEGLAECAELPRRAVCGAGRFSRAGRRRGP